MAETTSFSTIYIFCFLKNMTSMMNNQRKKRILKVWFQLTSTFLPRPIHCCDRKTSPEYSWRCLCAHPALRVREKYFLSATCALRDYPPTNLRAPCVIRSSLFFFFFLQSNGSAFSLLPGISLEKKGGGGMSCCTLFTFRRRLVGRVVARN